jgi:uncharacterized RDD family membrane protein YckC
MNCMKCGAMVADGAAYCHRCGSSIKGTGPGHRDAGFWLRVGAFLLDVVILSPAIVGAVYLVPFDPGNAQMIMNAVQGLGGDLRNVMMPWMYTAHAAEVAYFTLAPYFIFCESSSMQGTIGKYLLRIQVTSLDGRRITIGKATKRYLARFLSMMPWMFGFLMAGFTRRKQCLHDMIAGTLMVRRRPAQ